MQVNIKAIKRPKLITPFFNEEITPDNEFLTYIDCNFAMTKSSKVTPNANFIKQNLNNVFPLPHKYRYSTV